MPFLASKVKRTGAAGVMSSAELAKVQMHIRVKQEEEFMAARSKELNAKGAKTVFEEEVADQENRTTNTLADADVTSPVPKLPITDSNILTPTGGPWLSGRMRFANRTDTAAAAFLSSGRLLSRAPWPCVRSRMAWWHWRLARAHVCHRRAE